jgi:hypothetical protein
MMVSLQSGVIKKLADAILKSDQFAQDGRGRLYRFSNGIYKPDGESRVKCQVKAFLNVPTMRTA